MSYVIHPILGNIDVCSVCGDPVPEGRQVCPICMARIDDKLVKPDYSLSEDPPTYTRKNNRL